MYTYDEIIKIVWFLSLLVDLLMYRKFYEELILGSLKVILNSVQVVLGVCFTISIVELVCFWYKSWICIIAAILLQTFCILQKFMFIKTIFDKRLKIIGKVSLLTGSSLLSLFCSFGMGILISLNILLVFLCFTFFIITIKKESRRLDWMFLLLNYMNICFYIGWMVL